MHRRCNNCCPSLTNLLFFSRLFPEHRKLIGSLVFLIRLKTLQMGVLPREFYPGRKNPSFLPGRRHDSSLTPYLWQTSLRLVSHPRRLLQFAGFNFCSSSALITGELARKPFPLGAIRHNTNFHTQVNSSLKLASIFSLLPQVGGRGLASAHRGCEMEQRAHMHAHARPASVVMLPVARLTFTLVRG